MSWHARPAEDILAELGTDLAAGLSAAEGLARQARHGRNRLEGLPRASWWRVLLHQFRDVLLLILGVAAAVSLAIGHVQDALTIVAILVLNALLGFTQEWRAERALAALRQMLAPRCRVRRDGRTQEVDAEALVPGDVVELALGDRVPADVRLASVTGLATDEAALTGESAPVSKDAAPVPEATPLAERASMAWQGTTVVQGHAVGVVVATGLASAFGHVARMTEQVDRTTTPLQRQLARLGTRLGLIGLAVAGVVAGTGLLTGMDAESMFFTAVSLAVAVVPEGLPAVVTLTLALGVRTMARRRALLRRLAAAETLGAATVICTDKTGTLTQGEMTVREIWTADGPVTLTGEGYAPEGRFEQAGAQVDPRAHPDLLRLLGAALDCTHATLTPDEGGWRVVGEPTEGALVAAATKAGLERSHDEVVAELAFDSARKRMSTVVARDGGWTVATKGAPELVLERSTRLLRAGREEPLTTGSRAENEARFEAMARRGLRGLALAQRRLDAPPSEEAEDLERDLTFLGLVGILDPPRAEVPAAIAAAHSAGIRVLMITGDNPHTALAVARSIGLRASRALAGADLESATDAQLDAALAEDVVFARTSPGHKLRLVERLQALGEVVAMTGDGVNDAPALKRADIGIAMGVRGTDVARGAADIVLTDDDFASILHAVEEGRRQLANIRRFVAYLLSSNAGEVVAIFVALVSGAGLILLPVQILWMNLVTDGATAVALGLEPAHPDTLQRPPRPPREALISNRLWREVALLGAAIGAVTLGVYVLWTQATDPARAQTAAFTALIVAEKVNVLNFRSMDAPLRTVGFFSNPWLLVAIVAMLGLQVCAVYVPFLQRALHTVPLAPLDWLWIVLLCLPVFIVREALKRTA